MRTVSRLLALLAATLVLGGTARAQDAPQASDARLQGWLAALDTIDGAFGIGTGGDVAVGIVCIFAGPACEAAKRVAQRAVASYRRVAVRSWRARGITLPSKCLNFSVDGAQIDRVVAAYQQAKPNLSKGGAYLLTAYDLLGYGFIPVGDFECQDIARKEILRVRGLSEPGA
jgi:hypothetical protein